jgi:hypothetical protein
MAFTYDAGLRIRPPEPMPECISGESPQDYFSRVLSQCALESATSAENNSGDSAPTPFNLGQIQADIERNSADIDELETSVGTLQTDVSGLQAQFASGSVQYANGATSATAAFPDAGAWRVFITPVAQALAGLYITVNDASFSANFSAAGAAGSFQWFAIKVS